MAVVVVEIQVAYSLVETLYGVLSLSISRCSLLSSINLFFHEFIVISFLDCMHFVALFSINLGCSNCCSNYCCSNSSFWLYGYAMALFMYNYFLIILN